jgi:hypothetical protein
MRIRQCISSVAVALCVADRVAGHVTPGPQRAWRSVATVENDEQAASSAFTKSNGAASTTSNNKQLAGSTARDTTNERIVDSRKHNEDDGISSSESVPVASAHNQYSTTSGPSISARQDDAEPIPTPNPNALPIEPKITPAIGVAGAIMLVTGAALCLVGIKTAWLPTFLSTGYLASLAVTVLIVYVMNPDHSNAIQGAYMVAAVVTGLIFGAVSLVFEEVTEGLGCMLGSFCFAMWLLVLAPGGIIHSTAGRGILIGVITVLGFCLSFSRHTRMHALLCCTSFAGATATILGVDCFSRAGLKEFWLYLWNLNNKLFPLETNTYPITRGIRVEIACIVVVFLLGLVSQFQLWKVIKSRRAKNNEDRQRAENDRLEAEAAIGRDVEANNEKERLEWEAAYGEKSTARAHVDSGAGSSVETFGKDQYSVREREVDAIEISDIEERQTGRNSNGEDESMSDGHRASSKMVEETMERGEQSGRTSQDSSRSHQSQPDDNQEKTTESNNNDQAYAAGAPEVVPLPFRVPTEEQTEAFELEAKSQTHKDVDDTMPADGAAIPLQKLSLMKLNELYASDDTERRGGQASSVAATADDIAVLDDISPEEQLKRHSMAVRSVAQADRLAPPLGDHDNSRPLSMTSELEMVAAVEDDDEEALQREPVTIDETASPVHVRNAQEVSSATKGDRRLSDATRSSQPRGSFDGHPKSVSDNLVEQLPLKMSKIAMTYRTNEWAKHIADADHPEHGEDLERPSSPGIQVDTNFPEEVAKPVDVEALQQNNFANEPVLPAHTSSNASKKSHRKSRQSESTNNHSRRTSTQSATPIYSYGRSSSQLSLNRRDSSSASPVKTKIGSAKKTPMPFTNQTLVESPIEDAAETFEHFDSTSNANAYNNPLASASASNLLDERNSMLQRRQTTTSFNGFRSTPSLGMMSGAIPEGQAIQPKEHASGFASPTQSSPTLPSYLTSDDDNIILARRRSQLQSNPPQAATPTHKPRPSIYSTLAYDSHQPARQSSTNSVQQSARLSQWHQTLQADVKSKQPPRALETNARQNMMDERRQSELRHAKKKEDENRRQSEIDEAMRRGQLDGAHRDAMRRMQAKANRDGA